MGSRAAVTVYRPDSDLRHPLGLFRQMGCDLLASRYLTWQILRRDISVQYRQSFFGIAWAIIPPLVAAAGLTLASNSKVLHVGATDLPYPAYVMFSTALWQTFVESILLPIQKVTQSKMLLSRIRFPCEALILSGVGQVFFNFAFKLLLIVGMFIWFKLPLPPSVLFAPVGLLSLVMLGTCIGVLLAPFGALYKDIFQGTTLATGVWLFLTPVVYPVPKGDGIFGAFVRWNPVTPLLVTTRELATTGIVSDPQGFWLVSALAVIGLLAAWLVYRLAMPFVIERLSS